MATVAVKGLNIGQVTSTTLMLIAASCAFLVFNIPLGVYFLCYHFGAFGSEFGLSQRIYFRAASILSYTNYSVNFFLYFASGSKFRSAFISKFLVCRRRHSRGGQLRRTASGVVANLELGSRGRAPGRVIRGQSPLNIPREWPFFYLDVKCRKLRKPRISSDVGLTGHSDSH